jgi:hypothetical protein
MKIKNNKQTARHAPFVLHRHFEIYDNEMLFGRALTGFARVQHANRLRKVYQLDTLR